MFQTVSYKSCSKVTNMYCGTMALWVNKIKSCLSGTCQSRSVAPLTEDSHETQMKNIGLRAEEVTNEATDLICDVSCFETWSTAFNKKPDVLAGKDGKAVREWPACREVSRLKWTSRGCMDWLMIVLKLAAGLSLHLARLPLAVNWQCQQALQQSWKEGPV